MVTDLNMDIEIIGAPIVRESDGIAMSSRNTYLSPEQRAAARCLSRALFEARDLFSEGERRAEVLLDRVTSSIDAEPLAEIDYVQLCDVATLTDIDRIEKDAVLAAAVYFGQARLIDNVVLEVPS
jgi:pantoate--beta-alanine ligase